jgi:hypothetical protein
MFRPRTLLLPLSLSILGLAGGAYLGHRHAVRNQRRDFYVKTYGEIQDRIRVAEFIYDQAPDKGIQDLEQSLDRFVVIFGSSHHRPHLTPEERSILDMIARHRLAHPFRNAEHPDWDARVEMALHELR